MKTFDDSLPMLLYRALNTVMPEFRNLFAGFGVTEPQWRVLRVLWEESEISVRELSARTLLLAPSLVGVLDRLENAGLVERHRSQADRRQVLVRLTPAGTALQSDVNPRVDEIYREIEAAMDSDTYNHLVNGLQALAGTNLTTQQDAVNDE